MAAYYQKLDSPLGSIYIATDGTYLRILAIGKNWSALKNSLGNIVEKEHQILAQTKHQLEEYFSNQRGKV